MTLEFCLPSSFEYCIAAVNPFVRLGLKSGTVESSPDPGRQVFAAGRHVSIQSSDICGRSINSYQ